MKLLVHNIGCLVTPEGREAHAGSAQGKVKKLENAYVCIENGLIEETGTGMPSDNTWQTCLRLDAQGHLVTPGLVDAHTHLVFGGWRAHELDLKLAGVPYLDILAAGGGILSTVRATRAASQEALVEKAAGLLEEMLAMGVTTCEAKSGYGLCLADELKQLQVIRALQTRQRVELISTLMAAHAVPEEYLGRSNDYVRLIENEIIPAVAEAGLAKFCDVFCETGVFDVAQSRRVLLAGKKHGLRAKIHADEIDVLGGTALAREVDAISAEHLIATREQGIAELAESRAVACLLPATSFYLKKNYAWARQMIDAGIPVAVASDFNPGSCPGLSLPFAMNLACYQYGLRPEEVLTAVTLNAAAAVGMAETLGSLEAGKQADLVVWNAGDLPYILYRFGSNLAGTVVKRGKIVYSSQTNEVYKL